MKVALFNRFNSFYQKVKGLLAPTKVRHMKNSDSPRVLLDCPRCGTRYPQIIGTQADGLSCLVKAEYLWAVYGSGFDGDIFQAPLDFPLEEVCDACIQSLVDEGTLVKVSEDNYMEVNDPEIAQAMGIPQDPWPISIEHQKEV